ncbi:hypothetical protein Trco_001978 [Trichoderma cornu-damae]|uniref:Uncharacterized protein n=1 Tax=Trichoderma cornu-damae TaxID=654480 RepID=A0A9P8TY08_9HYPO|nr:hypothetical protein Trco_001978 [Trichoderma cornu-damae]
MTTQEAWQQRRFECLLSLQRGITHDPFGGWADLSSVGYGDILLPESYLSSAPFALHSLRGHVRLRFIRHAFNMPADASVFDIQGFLSRNPSVVGHLALNTVPSPDLVSRWSSPDCEINVTDRRGRKYNRRLLRAVRQLDWVDDTVNWVVQLSRMASASDRAALSALRKTRRNKILPGLDKKTTEPSTRTRKAKRWKRTAVVRMRRDRPNSLLRNVVVPEDVVEEVF